MPDNAVTVTRCFLSYHRRDNDVYLHVVDRLKEELAGRFEAATGRQLEIFVDRDSIGWGEDWRNKIRESVLGATFFIPVVTMRYFTSDACVEELNTFYENARQLGVTELVLPLVLAGSRNITSEHPIDEVRLIERLNFRVIEEEWALGYESPQWVAAVNRMIDDLDRSLSVAEAALSEREQSSGDVVEVGADSEADLSSLMNDVESTTRAMQDSFASMTALGAVIEQATPRMSAGSAQRRSAGLSQAVPQIADAASDFNAKATVFQQTVNSTDASVRAVVNELRSIDLPVADAQLDELLRSLHSMPELTNHLASIDQAVAGLRAASMTNVSMRRALQPAINAMQSMRLGLTTVQSWSVL
ncbi:TIR domain-containing protein [Microbacterium sp. K35]|uniref:TIR domain-containing protein n=1 Tax=Microbacterium sp. K35 TaxID=2305440 RepID=UPI00109B74BC|nr:toll/interleukin-1 receptor domain-containing protein [Microbacterium sp. K35]